MQALVNGNRLIELADPAVENNRVLLDIATSATLSSTTREKLTFTKLSKLVSRRTSIILETLILDGPGVLFNKTRHMFRRETLDLSRQVHCFVGSIATSRELSGVATEERFAGFSLTHPANTSLAVTRMEHIRPIAADICSHLAALSLYGAVLMRAAKTAAGEGQIVGISGEGLVADLAHEMLLDLGTPAFRLVHDAQPCHTVTRFGTEISCSNSPGDAVILLLEDDGKLPDSSHLNLVIFQLPGGPEHTRWRNANLLGSYDIEEITRPETRIVDLYYFDGEVQYPEWFSLDLLDSYLNFLHRSKLKIPSQHLKADAVGEGVSRCVISPCQFVTFDSGVQRPGKDTRVVAANTSVQSTRPDSIQIGLVGGGRWPIGMIIRTLAKDANVNLRRVCDRRPEVAYLAAQAVKFEEMTTLTERVIAADDISTVVVAPYHGRHGPIAAAALRNNKNVFVEKPPVISRDQLHELATAASRSDGILYVGYNRRFAPLNGLLLREMAKESGPTTLHFYMRSINIPPNNWYYWPSNGNRIISNICHLIDYALFLLPFAKPVKVTAQSALAGRPDENVMVNILFDEGSMANIVYSNRGSVHSGYFQRYVIARGRMFAEIDNFDSLKISRYSKIEAKWRGLRDMGHREQVRAFMDTIHSGGKPPVALNDILLSAMTVLATAEAAESKTTVAIESDSIVLAND